MSLVERLARAVPFQKWRKNLIFRRGEREKVQEVTENVLSHKKAQKAQNGSLFQGALFIEFPTSSYGNIFCAFCAFLWLTLVEEDGEVAAHVGLVEEGVVFRERLPCRDTVNGLHQQQLFVRGFDSEVTNIRGGQTTAA
ncbi:MAG TPA: hypothetical protein VF435_16105, partial [Pyrinomonadaceae bacterium]